MGGVLPLRKTIGREFAAEMIAAAGGHVHRAEDLFVLDVAPGDREVLRAKAEFAQLAGHRIGDELRIVRIDGRLVAAQQKNGPLDATLPSTVITPRVPSSYLCGNCPVAPAGT